MDLGETIKAVMRPMLEEKLIPLQSEIQNQALAIERLREEVASLHTLIARGVSPMEGNKTFDGTTGRKSMPNGPRVPLVSDQQPRLRGEELKSHRKVESGSKLLDPKRKSDELVSKREEEKATKDKQRKDAEQKRTEEEAKKKEGKAGKVRPGSAAKGEEAKKKPTVRRSSGERKAVKKTDDRLIATEGTLQTEESDRPSTPLDPSVLACLDSSPIHPDPIPDQCLPAEAKFSSLDQELQLLLTTYGEEPLIAMAPFQLSLGARSALSLLNTMEDSQLYLTNIPTRDEVYWTFRLFFQLCGDTLSDDKEEAWSACRMFIAAGKATGLESRVTDAASAFDFSNENIDLVETLLGGKSDRINPSLYNSFCTLSGLMMFPIKEALAYAGLIPDKVQPWRKYQRLLHKRKHLKQ